MHCLHFDVCMYATKHVQVIHAPAGIAMPARQIRHVN